jgi:arylsulfatase A-like enzyme
MPLLYPHPPYGVEEKYFDMIDKTRLPPRIPATEDSKTKPMILEGIRKGQKTEDYGEEFWDNLRAVYYGMCARLDDQFRLLMEALKKEGQYDNSAVFLFSDHGDFTGDYSLVEKTQNTFEDCLTKVPFIIKPPIGTDIVAGVNEELVELVDFPATVYDLLKLEVEYDHFGKSLLPIMAGDVKEIRNAAFCEGGRMMGEVQASEIESYREDSLYMPRVNLQISDEKPWHGKAVMCRTKNYKYVSRYYENDEFYDLNNDPSEEFNQINNKEYATIIAEHKQILLEWYMATCDVVPRKPDKRG